MGGSGLDGGMDDGLVVEGWWLLEGLLKGVILEEMMGARTINWNGDCCPGPIPINSWRLGVCLPPRIRRTPRFLVK